MAERRHHPSHLPGPTMFPNLLRLQVPAVKPPSSNCRSRFESRSMFSHVLIDMDVNGVM